MKIVIIEDEKLTAEDLADVILKLQPDAQLVAFLRSVKEAVAYFETTAAPDLIFSDIQLGDGVSFDIFKTINVAAPIIFCTAYDEYAMNAFKTNGIDYILKPFTEASIVQALNKYHSLCRGFSPEKISYDAIFDLFVSKIPQKTSSILVTYKDKIIPVKTDHIALFYIANEETSLLTFDHKTYVLNKNLEELEKLSGDDFFRVNRQYLVNRKAVKDAAHFFSRKLVINLSVSFKEPITISKEKTPQFLEWLARK
ncbi:DNA-binding LytR/AlgR family response regulator [Pedobacter cryoconitis]|uniref:DNA-binding LytR/AlgR family response regulator n=1 Tax=Pedobacter cryoconitis TaxID=188932 RepID=A0A7W9E2X8_9SPHI|nr:LytTR family DNA-binding domain-containing protein [Pedobacter cryoconitis]MBB5639325.1 DNA-binding LytR/AlgR family response regulator [Pedobacter cryoconitis]